MAQTTTHYKLPRAIKFNGDSITAISPSDMFFLKIPMETLGVDANVGKSMVGLYPNPVGEWMKIDIPAEFLEADYTIYSVTGHLVMKGKLTSQTIETGLLTKGLYLLLVNSDGKALLVKRFVKE